MRATSRLLAAVKSARFHEPGAPTGLTGLHNHPSPHTTLSYLYSSTLDKLSHIPETSVYRQSTEALTKHRLQIVEAVKPEGLEAWNERLKKKLEGMDARFSDGRAALRHSHQGRQFLTVRTKDIGYGDEQERAVEWSGEEDTTPEQEGPISEEDFAERMDALEGTEQRRRDLRELMLEPEPQLTAEQISELETKIGAGLIEEVIQVAEGEHKLVNIMVDSKVWEDLEEKPAEGQWGYHERPTHTSTQ